MQLHPGLRKYFYSLSSASKRVQDKKLAREQLRGHLRKIKIVSSQSPKKSVISSELAKLEQNLSEIIEKKMQFPKKTSLDEKRTLVRLKEKESELNQKIEKMNELLFKLGKKVNEEEVKKQLDDEIHDKPTLLEALEEKLYVLESKYFDLENTQKYSEDELSNLKSKIRELKDKLWALKNR
ncbi:MAG: hypothetical protein AABW88_03985 [Nanoarchaeota archaeon]